MTDLERIEAKIDKLLALLGSDGARTTSDASPEGVRGHYSLDGTIKKKGI